MKRARVTKSWSKQNLPTDSLPEILSRLPVKSLLRFRCVSNSWRSLIDSPYLCRLHLKNFKNNILETHLFVDQRGATDHGCVVRCSKTFRTVMRLDTLDTTNGCIRTLPTLDTVISWSVICSLDGLVLLRSSQLARYELILWNPSIRRARSLHTSVTISPSAMYVDLAFGFNPSIRDYKHVRFVPLGENKIHSIEVYTVGIKSWRTIPFQHNAGGSNWRWTFRNWNEWKTVCCKGILYFTPRTIADNARELVSFDLSTEVFASARFPFREFGIRIIQEALTLVDGGDSVAWVSASETSGSIWVMEGSGSDTDPMRWISRYKFASKIGLSEQSLDSYLCVKKNGEMLLKWKRRVTAYDLKTHNEKTLVMNGRGLRMGTVCGYVESLVLLNG